MSKLGLQDGIADSHYLRMAWGLTVDNYGMCDFEPSFLGDKSGHSGKCRRAQLKMDLAKGGYKR